MVAIVDYAACIFISVAQERGESHALTLENRDCPGAPFRGRARLQLLHHTERDLSVKDVGR
jgi:hypothetical protein